MSSKSKQGGKKPRRLVVGVILDDEIADAEQVASQAYDVIRLELERTRPRRLAEYAAAGVEPDKALDRVQDEDLRGLAEQQERVDRARAALDDATLWFVFEAIGHRRLQALITQHPATDEQVEKATAQGQQLAWNPDTFLPALTEDACVVPVDVDWEAIWQALAEPGDDGLPPKSPWSSADVEVLAATAIAANQSLRTAPKDRQPSIRQLVGE